MPPWTDDWLWLYVAALCCLMGVGASFEKTPSSTEFALVRAERRGWSAAWLSRSSFLPATASSSVTSCRRAVIGRMSGAFERAASAKMPPWIELFVSCEVRGVGWKAAGSAKMPAVATRHRPSEPGCPGDHRAAGVWRTSLDGAGVVLAHLAELDLGNLRGVGAEDSCDREV